jgi:hypothetical protein
LVDYSVDAKALRKAASRAAKSVFSLAVLMDAKKVKSLVAHSVGKWAYLLVAWMAPQKVDLMAAPSVFWKVGRWAVYWAESSAVLKAVR